MTDSDATGRTGDSDGTERGRRGRRDIVVPMRLYKTITVFSTLIAVVGVVLADGLLSTALAVVGLSIIAFGAVVYTLGTRFRAQGMGKSQEDSGEDSNNG